MDNETKNILFAIFGVGGIVASLFKWLFPKGGMDTMTSWGIVNVKERRKKEADERDIARRKEEEEKAAQVIRIKQLEEIIASQDILIDKLKDALNIATNQVQIIETKMELLQEYLDKILPNGDSFAKKLGEVATKKQA